MLLPYRHARIMIHSVLALTPKKKRLLSHKGTEKKSLLVQGRARDFSGVYTEENKHSLRSR